MKNNLTPEESEKVFLQIQTAIVNVQRRKCLKIKYLLEEISGFEDIGKTTRISPLPDIRKMYSKLCSDYTIASDTIIADALGDYERSSIVSQIKMFNVYYPVNSLNRSDIYDEAVEILSDESYLDDDPFEDVLNLIPIELDHACISMLVKMISRKNNYIEKLKNTRTHLLAKLRSLDA